MDLSTLGNNTHNLDNEFTKHCVFNQLADYIDFYDMLSYTTMGFASTGVIGVINLNTHVFSSIKGTVDSIKLVLSNGRINDAYALLRKYYDSTIINIYTNLYIEENSSIEKYIVDEIQNWIKGTGTIPEYRVLSQYIKNYKRLNTVTELIMKNDHYKNIRKRCNDHTHYNYYHNIIYNDNQLYLENRVKYLDMFSNDLKAVFIQHFAYLFYLKDYYMSSTNYIDYLEQGMEPPEDSQYWVASFIQDTFDKWIKPHRPDIAKVILDNTVMKLI